MHGSGKFCCLFSIFISSSSFSFSVFFFFPLFGAATMYNHWFYVNCIHSVSDFLGWMRLFRSQLEWYCSFRCFSGRGLKYVYMYKFNLFSRLYGCQSIFSFMFRSCELARSWLYGLDRGFDLLVLHCHKIVVGNIDFTRLQVISALDWSDMSN